MVQKIPNFLFSLDNSKYQEYNVGEIDYESSYNLR